jgi:hypothetical protein
MSKIFPNMIMNFAFNILRFKKVFKNSEGAERGGIPSFVFGGRSFIGHVGR